jgi:tryptophan 2,3-dioxygenase
MSIQEIKINEILNSMHGEGNTDYEAYLKTKDLLSLQSPYNDLCNPDELQFQIVHQTEELLFKLLNYTLIDIQKNILEKNTYNVTI